MEISIIIPIYNTGKILKRTINSLLNQSFQDFKILLVDDGSNCSITKKICEEYTLKDKRIHLFRKKNEGIEKARIFGMKHVKSRFFMFLDHDDYYKKNALYTLHQAAINYNADIVSANYYFKFKSYLPFKIKTYGYSEIKETDREEFIKNQYRNFFGNNLFNVSTWAKIYRTTSIKINQIEAVGFNFLEDIHLNVQMFSHANKVVFIPDVIYYHFHGGLSSKENTKEVLSGYFTSYDFRKAILKSNNIEEIARSLDYEIMNVILPSLNRFIETGRPKQDFIELLEFIYNNPTFIKVYNSFDSHNQVINDLYNKKCDDIYTKLLNEFRNDKKRRVKAWIRNKL